MSSSASQLAHADVRVIIPVYKNLAATRRCVESVYANPLPSNVAITLIVDGSPEPEVVEYCELQGVEKGCEVIVNQRNQGFVRTANQGFALDAAADVILLNSDTCVHGNWLERLHNCAYLDSQTGTATPFSNNGTICSYPLFPYENALPASWDLATLDTLFADTNSSQSHAIPTAVGFCMYIKRPCLEATGEFDAENFGQGYGEECDFSMRATALGWHHVLCADLFVYHEGGASFSTQSTERKHHADGVMARLHPTYDDLITDFIAEDPLRPLRNRVTRARVEQKPEDVGNVIRELSAFNDALRGEIEKEKERTDEVRDEVDKVQSEREKLDSLLDEARTEYAATQAELDKAHTVLDEAHKALDDLSTNFANLQTEAGELLQQVDDLSQRLDSVGSQLHASQDHNNALSTRLQQIENSRSWRYTRWLRREK